MTKKKMPKAIEECNAGMERTQFIREKALFGLYYMEQSDTMIKI